MLLTLFPTKKFRRYYKRVKKRGKDMSKLEMIIDQLRAGHELDTSWQDHALMGNYAGFRECRIEPDWPLIYAIDNDKLILTASRTGSHSDLF